MARKTVSDSGDGGLKTVTIGGKSCAVGLFAAEEGWRLLHKLTRIIGPAISLFGAKQWSAGLKAIFSEMDENEMIALIKLLTSVVQVEGRKFTTADMANYAFTIEACAAVVKENFSDFFLELTEMAGDLSPGTKEKI